MRSRLNRVTLTDFLAARIAEDEAAAWRHIADADRHGWGSYPDRVLAECAAKRVIIEDFEMYAQDYRDAPSDFAAGRRHAALLAVTRLAEVYADHRNYQQEWAP